ncbi:hypothetical protein CKM354_000763700 [Cercospora kikuchii]|uniref:BTB domain-containing protein n=1 Tax=Cercospora kikuchii TaxID=84275 RepID=A0A9P3CHE2_9PEZI|nr:uncharacterized protein CKM354_000763700 [Cercospora kikuchii]GIZ44439.1 hypothetical protein CKM354_000763700 [Cercospora kikuchii]
MSHETVFRGAEVGYPEVVSQVPDMNPEELYRPTMVSITIKDGTRSETFHVPRELICSRSDYFRATFMGRFSESWSLATTLDETSTWTFKTFVNWLYTSRLALPQAPTDLLGEAGDAKDPTTWPMQTLFDLYAFADRFDTRLLRRLVIEQVIFSIASGAGYPSMQEIAWLYETLPRSSPLIRFICYNTATVLNSEELVDFRKQILAELGDVEVASEFNSDLLAMDEASKDRCLECKRLRQLSDDERLRRKCDVHRLPPYTVEWRHPEHKWCFWHEHEKDENEWEEKLVCAYRAQNYEERIRLSELSKGNLCSQRKGMWSLAMFA